MIVTSKLQTASPRNQAWNFLPQVCDSRLIVPARAATARRLQEDVDLTCQVTRIPKIH